MTYISPLNMKTMCHRHLNLVNTQMRKSEGRAPPYRKQFIKNLKKNNLLKHDDSQH